MVYLYYHYISVELTLAFTRMRIPRDSYNSGPKLARSSQKQTKTRKRGFVPFVPNSGDCQQNNCGDATGDVIEQKKAAEKYG